MTSLTWFISSVLFCCPCPAFVIYGSCPFTIDIPWNGSHTLVEGDGARIQKKEGILHHLLLGLQFENSHDSKHSLGRRWVMVAAVGNTTRCWRDDIGPTLKFQQMIKCYWPTVCHRWSNGSMSIAALKRFNFCENKICWRYSIALRYATRQLFRQVQSDPFKLKLSISVDIKF